MPPRIARCLIAVVVLANAATSALYCGTGPNDPTTRGVGGTLRAALQAIADILTVPIPMPGITDVRDVVLVASLGLALLLVALGSAGFSVSETLDLRRSERGTSVGHTVPGLSSAAWLTVCGVAVVGAGLLSAIFNSTWDLSWGWIVRFAAGAAWAVLIARVFSSDMVRATLVALLIVAVSCLVLTILDRAARGMTLFRWPIGPITITAGLAAIWAAMAGSWAAGLAFCRRLRWSTALLLAGALIAVYVLQQTGRRAPALGLIAAAVAAGAMLFWGQYRNRVLGACLVGSFLILALVAGLWVNRQLRNPDREISGSVDLRVEYWRHSADLVRRHPLLGVGPDVFVVAMTNAIEPLRAEAPHFYHGNIDPYAHNEWIQAAVELGLPGALAYLALPLGLIVLVFRRLPGLPTNAVPSEPNAHVRRGGAPSPSGVIMVALSSGLVAVLVTEGASITLRTPMMPVWYWTLLGLLAAVIPATRFPGWDRSRADVLRTGEAIQPGARANHSPGPPPGGWTPLRRGGTLISIIILIAALACLAGTAAELSRAVAQGRNERGPEGRFASRFYGEKTLSGRYDALLLAGQAATLRPDSTALAAAVAQARELHQLMPSLHDVPALYAQLLLYTSQPAEARRVLEEALSPRHNPYEPAANVVYAGLRQDDPVVRLRCVQRALRHEALDANLQRILDEAAAHPAGRAFLQEELPAARAAVKCATEARAAEGGAAEWLRINAHLEDQAGRQGEAIADQRAAADFYRRLEQSSSRSRRPSPAEIDAFFVLSQLIYESTPSAYLEAYEAIVATEYYLLLGIAHEEAARPRPQDGLAWGVLIPAEFPERWRPVWRFSARLHLAAGRDAYIDTRILASLPREQWTTLDVEHELATLALQVYQDLARLPPEQRPAHHAALLNLARPALAPEARE